MSIKSDSPLVASLGALFAGAGLRVELAGRDERTRRRKVAFYDEVLLASIRLSFPASTSQLPPPAAGLRPTFALPLPPQSKTSPAYEEEGDDEEFEARNRRWGQESSVSAPPRLLALLVSSLHVSLDASYVTPRLEDATATSSQQWSGYSTIPVPSTDASDSSYQAPLASTSYQQYDVTPMYATSWAGDQIPPPPKPDSTMQNKKSRKNDQTISPVRARRGTITKRDSPILDDEDSTKQERGAEIRLVEHGKELRWEVEWRCEVPVVYMRTRHPSPALTLTSSLALRLVPMQLHRFAQMGPHKDFPSSDDAAIEALYSHDLLSALSEGPSYPDESPAERAARANASLARLPLGKLPSNVLGSRLVTPMRGAKDIDRLLQRQKNAEIDESAATPRNFVQSRGTSQGQNQSQELDMGDGLNSSILPGGATSSTSQNSSYSDSPRLDWPDDEGKGGLGQEIRLLRRSARKVMDVRNAIAVRMRVAVVPGILSRSEISVGGDEQLEEEDQEEEEQGQERRPASPSLVLCVEVENATGSGLQFLLESINIHFAQPFNNSLHQEQPPPDVLIEAAPVPGGIESMPFHIEQGEQRNLLYHVRFHSSLSQDDIDFGSPSSLLTETQRQRHVSINIEGRPLLLSVDAEGNEMSHPATARYCSTWSCQLDLSRQLQSVALDLVAAAGSGQSTLGGAQKPQVTNRSSQRSLVAPSFRVPIHPSGVQSAPQISSNRRPSPLTVRPPPTRSSSTVALGSTQSPGAASSGTPRSATLPRTPFELRMPSPLASRTPSTVPSGASNDSGLATPRANDVRAFSTAMGQGDGVLSLRRDSNLPLEMPQQSWDALSDAPVSGSGRKSSTFGGQGLLARARMRAASAAMADGGTASSSRAFSTKLNGVGEHPSHADLTMRSSSLSASPLDLKEGGQRDITPIPLHLQRSNVFDARSDRLLPLDAYHAKATTARSDLVQQLVRGASYMQGVLIEVDVLPIPSSSSADGDAMEGERLFDVRLTLSNRSEETKSLSIGWLHRSHLVRPVRQSQRSSQVSGTRRGKNDAVGEEEAWLKKTSAALEGTELRSALRFSDDDVHVGPIAPGTTELASLRLVLVDRDRECKKEQGRVVALGQLKVLDIDTGEEKILDDLQRLVL